MNNEELNRLTKRAADWVQDYREGLRSRAVRSGAKPGEIAAKFANMPPEDPVSADQIFDDFEAFVPDGMTHWQHPRFFAYFPSMATPASVLAEHLANAMSAMCMLWQTSPVATEMEEVMMEWMRQAFGLHEHFTGTIHDSATTASLAAIITMRDQATNWAALEDGCFGGPRLRIYASSETHSSIDKCVRLSGIGQNNLVKVPTTRNHSMDPLALERLIRDDLDQGHKPTGVVLCVGGTSIGAMDPIAECIEIAKAHDLPVHVDAAWAGNFMIAEEYRHFWKGIDGADSIVINPYKGLGIQFDGALQFLRDPTPQIRSMGLKPEYLKTLGDVDAVTDYEEWTIPLGRRFRALKIWFVLRAYGLTALRKMKIDHVTWTTELAAELATIDGVEITTEPVLGLFTFALADEESTEALLTRINDDGRTYLTQTRVEDRLVIRVTVGNYDTSKDDVMMVADIVRDLMA